MSAPDQDWRFVAEIGDVVGASDEPADLLRAVCTRTGEYLDVDRCLFVEVQEGADAVIVDGDFARGLAPAKGTHPLSWYGAAAPPTTGANQPLVVEDAGRDAGGAARPAPPPGLAPTGAFVAIPFTRAGRWVASFLVTTIGPRRWAAREINLLRNVAQHTWLAVERLRGTEALRRREAELRALTSDFEGRGVDGTARAGEPSSRAREREALLEERFRSMVESVSDYAIFMIDGAGRVATWNRGAERLKGYTEAEIRGRSLSLFYTPEDVAAGSPRRELDAAVANERYEGEGWRVRKDGTRFWASVVINAIRDGAGEVIGFAKVTRDVSDRHRAADQLRLAIEAAPTGMLMVDHAGNIALVNAQIEKLFGYTRDELMGHPVEMLVPERLRARHPVFRAEFLRAPRARPMGVGRDLFGVRKDGTELPIEIGLNPLRTTEGDFILSSVVDITERKKAEREREGLMSQLKELNTELEARVNARTSELTAALREREVLLQEVHHRVKNNLQVIWSLINMQLRRVEDGSSRDALTECQTRVQAIALIHEKLYQSKDYARVPFSEYARSLAESVFAATGVAPEQVALDLAIDDVALPVDEAIPCGLVLNELIMNSLKHAFRDGRTGTIRVELGKVADGRVRLAVTDDGVGLPGGFDLRSSESLGMQLVCTLSEQLEADLEVNGRAGAAFQLTFPGRS